MYIVFKIILCVLYLQSLSFTQNTTKKCSICLETLSTDFSIDAWNNPFHTYHQQEGVFCNSCSRIISAGITQGGYSYSDGRHICTLCHISVIKNKIEIEISYKSVIKQLNEIGIKKIPNNIPIKLINSIELNKITKINNHGNIKGYTQINYSNEKNKFKIFILTGLPKIEFEATLAHELLHVWLDLNNFHHNLEISEGFCNLGRELIYKNNNTHFSQIHLNSMLTDTTSIYGSGYRKIKLIKDKIGWKELINNFEKIK